MRGKEIAKISNKTLLLLLIFAFSFVYRVVFMLWSVYPSGADIGLHNSVIYSVTGHGNTNFLYNFYQIGGGLSLTFPGYHIFTAMVIMLTGMPDYIAHTMAVSLLSSLTVLAAYMLTKTVWRESVAVIVAFLVAISRFDIETLLWGGYPNAVTLMLIPLIFAMLLQQERFSKKTFLAATSILIGSLFLTHSLSALLFVTFAGATIFLGLIFSKRIEVPRVKLLNWLLPMGLGALLVSPFLIQMVPAYLNSYGGGASGAEAIKQALINTKLIPLDFVLPLFLCIPAFILFSRKYYGRLLSLPSILLGVWILIPTVATQSYLIGLYTDYNRFLYFMILLVIMVTALLIDHMVSYASGAISKAVAEQKSRYKPKDDFEKLASKLIPRLTKRNLYSILLLGILLFAFFAIPLFADPKTGAGTSEFYQFMTPPGYSGIQWIKQNTPEDSVFVADAHYGWWLSGFAQRPTLSAVSPEYLTLTREFAPSQMARYLLDSDYVIDNGVIQVREDGGYIGRNNPQFSAKTYNNYFPYYMFNFNNNYATVDYTVGTNTSIVSLLNIPVVSMNIENSSDSATITIYRENRFFSLTQQTTVFQGSKFAEISFSYSANVVGVSINKIKFNVDAREYGVPLAPMNGSIAFYDQGQRVYGQLIFTQQQPWVLEDYPRYTLDYILDGNSNGKIAMYASAYQISLSDVPRVSQIVADNLNSYHQKTSDLPLDVFDYRTSLADYNVSFVACRDFGVMQKFKDDPEFTLVFINNDVAIFSTKR
jgi:hypothetical protein